MINSSDRELYRCQGFGASLGVRGTLALLIVDFVNGFADSNAFGGGNIAEAIAATKPLLDTARRLNWPVVFSRIVFADDGADQNVFALKVPSLLRLTEFSAASAIVDTLKPLQSELVIRKTGPSAFFGTSLSAWLTQRRVETLLVAGCTTSGCVRASVVDAMSCGFRPVVLSDCVGDRATEPHAASLFDLEQKYADVMTSHDLLQFLPHGAF